MSNQEDIGFLPYGYLPSPIPNIVFLSVICACGVASITIFLRTGRCRGFTVLLLLTHILAAIAYAQRITDTPERRILHYVADVVTSTMAPAFLTMALHLCTRNVIVQLGAEHAPFVIERYISATMSASIIALLIQGIGFAVSFSDAVLQRAEIQAGENGLGEMLTHGGYVVGAGLLISTLSLLFALGVLGTTLVRAYMTNRATGYRTFHGGAGYAPLSLRFKVFTAVLFFSIVCLIMRCAYRLAYFFGGMQKSVARSEALYIAIEGVLFTFLLVLLVVFHPALWLANAAAHPRIMDVEGLKEQEMARSRTHSRSNSDAGEGTALNEGSQLILKPPQKTHVQISETSRWM